MTRTFKQSLPTIQLLAKCQKRVISGYPWVYANEIEQSNSTKSIEPGQLVELQLHGKFLAIGYFNRHSLIAFRVLTRNPDEAIDADFFKKRLQNALALREHFFEAPYYRLIHAEGDDLPGLIIDRFNDVFVLQLNTQGMDKLREPLIAALTDLFQPSTLYFKNDTNARQKEGLLETEPVIIGKPLQELRVIENEMNFSIDLSTGQKTGWFYDHRENRRLVASLVLARSSHVIDYYCYSGGFSLQAAKTGAKRVIGVDRSESAILNARKTAAENGLEAGCEFVCQDVFKDMDSRIESSQKFDIVILDPPAFVKVKKDLAAGLKGYEKLLNKGIQLTAPGGFLLIASCSYHVKEEDLHGCLMRALSKYFQRSQASKGPRSAKIVKRLQAGPDHPVHPMLEESEYLKGFLVHLN